MPTTDPFTAAYLARNFDRSVLVKMLEEHVRNASHCTPTERASALEACDTLRLALELLDANDRD